MKLTQTGSLWGNTYKLWHFIDGHRVSADRFQEIYTDHQLTPEDGFMTLNATSKFRKDWIVPNEPEPRRSPA